MNASYPKIFAALLAALTVCTTAQADSFGTGSNKFDIDFVDIGDAGNAADTTGYGAVSYEFNIGKYEVTIDQYTTFLNSVASVTSDGYIVNLWNANMTSDINIAGISRSGSGTLASPYSYSVIGSGNHPIAYVSWFDAARFANWLNNGATSGASTESGAYTLSGATSGIFTKNAGANWWIPGEDEWYKAAYYKGNGINTGYWVYPTQSDTAPGNSVGGDPNQANYYAGDYAVTQSASYFGSQNYLTDVGAFSSSASAYGTYDQGGNLREWNDALIGSSRGLRGGCWYGLEGDLRSSVRDGGFDPTIEDSLVGFRLASVPQSADPGVPEPGTWASGVLLAGGAAFVRWRRRQASL